MKRKCVERVNNHRSSLHAQELTLNDSLSTEARRYCEMIAKAISKRIWRVNLSICLNKRDEAGMDNQKVLHNVAVFESTSGSPALDVMHGNNDEAKTTLRTVK